MAQEKMAQEKMAQENKAQEKNGTLFSLGKNGTVQNVLKKTQAKNDTIRQYNQLKCVHTLFLYILLTFLIPLCRLLIVLVKIVIIVRIGCTSSLLNNSDDGTSS